MSRYNETPAWMKRQLVAAFVICVAFSIITALAVAGALFLLIEVLP